MSQIPGIELIGGVHVAVDLRISHEEFAQWRPETIRAFFAGLALVLSARDAGSQQGRMDVSMAALGVAVDSVSSVVTDLKSAASSSERTEP